VTAISSCRECDRAERTIAQLELALHTARVERDKAVCKAGRLQNEIADLQSGSDLRARLLRAQDKIARLEARVADLEEGIVR